MDAVSFDTGVHRTCIVIKAGCIFDANFMFLVDTDVHFTEVVRGWIFILALSRISAALARVSLVVFATTVNAGIVCAGITVITIEIAFTRALMIQGILGINAIPGNADVHGAGIIILAIAFTYATIGSDS
jgi:hypothetical protein